MSGSKEQVRTARRAAGLLAIVLVIAVGLFSWKANAAPVGPPQSEPMESVTDAVATTREYRPTATAIGTVLAMRSVTLRNELAGTVRTARLTPGQVVGPGEVLVALDVSVEEAELRALEARAVLADATLERMQRLAERRAVSAIDLDNARAERDVARADMDRIRAVIGRKTIRAPFRARVGISDVHTGQFLDAGTALTTLQGVDEDVHVDFAVAQDVAAVLRPGDVVQVFAAEGASAEARIVAVDARIDPATRNAAVRARVDHATALTPGASVRVVVPAGAGRTAAAVPVSALRKGPAGDHVFVLQADGPSLRAYVRPVTAGPVLGDEVVILSGLEPGERVAVSGSFKLRDAALVHVAAPTATAAEGR